MRKIIIGVVIFLVVLIAAAIAIPFLFKDKIIAKAKEEINKTLNAKVNFGDFDLTLITSFPKLKFTLNDFTIIGVKEFEGDTLTSIKSLELKLNIWDVIGGSNMKISSVVLHKAYINIIVLKDGKANYDITKPDSSASGSSSPSSFQMALQYYGLKNSRVSYDDRSLDFKMTMENLNHEGSGDFTADLFKLVTNTTIDKTNLWYGGMKYISNAKAKLDADLDMDMKNFKFTFKENELALNELILGMDGWLAMPKDDIDMDLKWNVKKTDFRNFISMVPGVYSASFKDIKSSGKLAMNGFVKGTYNEKKMPGFGVILKVDNGMFQYPSLPTAVKNVNIDLDINNKDGVPDNTIINLKKMHVEFGDEPFDAKLYVTTPVSDANIDAMAKGTVNLANIKKMVPMDGSDLNGIIKADVVLKGRYSSIENQEYEKFNAAGTFQLTGMNYKGVDMPAVTINNMLLTFNPKNVTLNDFNAKMGRSDMKASGSIDNLLAYYFKDELLKGSFNFNSTLLDLNELMTSSSTTTTTAAPDTSSMSVIEVPSNIDFSLNSSVGKILYDNLVIENLKGNILMRDAKINMQDLFFNMLNGSVKMNGTYATPKPNSADIDYNLSLTGFDIQQTFKTFNTVQKLVPVAERANGKFSTEISVAGKLDQHMQPVITSLNGKGKLTSQNVTVNNFEPLNKIADALKMPEYKSLPLENLDISFKFKDGRVYVDPFETSLKGSNATIEGSNGFDQTINYTMKVAIPKNKMSAGAQSALSGVFAKANNIAGTQLQLPDPLKVNLAIGGTVLKPTIKTDFANQGKAVVETIKEDIKEKVTEQVDNAKAKAKEQADKIIADAQKQAQQIRDAAKAASDKARTEGYAAADKVVKETKNPIAKKVAEETAKKMKSETDKKCQKIIDEGNKNAQAVIDEAKKKSDALLK